MEAKNFARECSNNISSVVILSLAILLFISNMQTTLAATTSTAKSYTNYIKSACNSTTYPSVCYKTLSSYASDIKTNPLKLCNTALSLTLNAARNASSMVTNLAKQKGLSSSEIAIVRDCIETISDSIDELKESLDEMGSLGGADAEFHMANMRTWVSAALTDEDTCTDGFDEKKVSSSLLKNKIRNSVLNLAKMTSNTLALINSLSY